MMPTSVAGPFVKTVIELIYPATGASVSGVDVLTG